MPNILIISVVCKEHPELVERLANAVLNSSCEMADSRMGVVAGDAVLLLTARGEWNNLARLETALGKLEKTLGAAITMRRISELPRHPDLLPYLAEVVGLNHPEILPRLSEFFRQHEIKLLEMVTHSYEAAQTGAPMFSVSLTLGIPADVSLAGLREEFFERCDQLNVDAVLEPVKG